jgi:hypothetical protein
MARQSTSDRAREAEGLTQGEAIAIAIAVGWMVVVGIFFWTFVPNQSGGDSFASVRWILMFIAIFVPVGVIGVAAVNARAVRYLREDLFRVQSALDRLQRTQSAQQAMVPSQIAPQTPEPQPIATQDTPTQDAPVSRFASRREVSRLIVPRAAPQAPADQPALALDTPPEDENPPIERPDLIKALNFPDDENDNDGFAALRRALRDRGARKLVQASQDVLTLLSQDGIYMDDLRPEPVSSDLWRRFAQGERGKAVDRLGAITDQTYLSLVSRRMREDTIFRDSVHHFLRRFDQTLVTFAEHATDTDLLELAETRTARAFMLLGRTTGTFD